MGAVKGKVQYGEAAAGVAGWSATPRLTVESIPVVVAVIRFIFNL